MHDFNFLANSHQRLVVIGGAGCLITMRRRGTIAALLCVCECGCCDIVCQRTHTDNECEAQRSRSTAATFIDARDTAKHTPVIIAQSNLPGRTHCANNAAIVPNQRHALVGVSSAWRPFLLYALCVSSRRAAWKFSLCLWLTPRDESKVAFARLFTAGACAERGCARGSNESELGCQADLRQSSRTGERQWKRQDLMRQEKIWLTQTG